MGFVAIYTLLTKQRKELLSMDLITTESAAKDVVMNELSVMATSLSLIIGACILTQEMSITIVPCNVVATH